MPAGTRTSLTGGGFTDRQTSDHLNLAFKVNAESISD